MDEQEPKIETFLRNYKGTWPPRIFFWAWSEMPRVLYKPYKGNDVIDYYKKLANKKRYKALIISMGLKLTPYESSL